MRILIIFFISAISFISCTIAPGTVPAGLTFTSIFNTKNTTGISCYRIPTITTAPNGDLVAAIDERVPDCGDLRTNKDINIVIRRSSDNGKTWTAVEKVIDYPNGQSASDPSFIVDKTTNTIFMFYNYMNLNTEKDIYYFMVTKSSDNGKTWSTPVDITSQVTKSSWHNHFKFITSGNGTQTKDGKLLHTIVNLNSGLYVFGSDNHGDSWYLIDKSITPGDESKIIELNDGSWMINSRVNKVGYRYIHTSTNEGLSWTTISAPALPDPGCNASILRYSSVAEGDDKNRLIFVNAKDAKQRKNLTIRISYDEGKTWSTGKTIYTGGAAYSSLTLLKNGEIGLIFEKDEYKDNTFVSISMKWLTDGKDLGIQ